MIILWKIYLHKKNKSKKNYLGNSFRPDFSSPSTHLTYGYWVGATPDGRKSRDMLGYGVDPLYGEASNGLGFRMLSNMKLPFEKFSGGYASHIGVDPKFFEGDNLEEKGIKFYHNIIQPLFFNELCTMILSSPTFGILKPTHDLVEILIEFAFAKKVNVIGFDS